MLFNWLLVFLRFTKLYTISLNKSIKWKEEKADDDIAVPLLLLHLPESSFQILSQMKRNFSFHLVSYGTWSPFDFWFRVKHEVYEKLENLKFLIKPYFNYDTEKIDTRKEINKYDRKLPVRKGPGNVGHQQLKRSQQRAQVTNKTNSIWACTGVSS